MIISQKDTPGHPAFQRPPLFYICPLATQVGVPKVIASSIPSALPWKILFIIL